MRKILLLLFFFLLPIVSANPVLNITPNPIDIYVLQNTVQSFYFNVSNEGNESLYNLTFTPITGFSFPKDVEINPTESKMIQFNVTGLSTIPSIVITNASFYYNETVYLGGTSYTMTITSSGFSEVAKTVYKSDSITFRNNDAINHTVTQFSPAGYNKELVPNEETTITFNAVGTFYYKDMTTGLSTTITVVDNAVQQKSHDPALDKVVTINYTFVMEKANLTAESVSPTSFALDYRASGEGAIVLKTNVSTYSVRLGSGLGWTTFDDYDFKMNENATKAIKFTIKPNIEKKTNATGITYNETIQITSSNSDSINITIPVYIFPYEFGSYTYNGSVCPPITTYSIEGVDNVLSFCTANPDYGRCPELYVLVKEISRQNEANFSQEQFEAWVASVPKTITYFDSINTQLPDINNKLVTYLSDFRSELNAQTVQLMNQSEMIEQRGDDCAILTEEVKFNRALVLGLVIFFIITFFSIGGYILVKRKKPYENKMLRI